MKKLEFSEFKELSARGNVIPVYATYLADLLTPVSAFLRLRQISRRAFLLESVEGGEKTARFSFLGCDPFSVVSFANGKIEDLREGQSVVKDGNIFEYVKDLFSKYRAVHPPDLPRFAGGTVGYLGYETIGLIEKVPVHEADEPDIPDALFMLFDTALAFDHLKHQIYVIANVFLDEAHDSLQEIYKQALQRIDKLKSALDQEAQTTSPAPESESTTSSNFTRSDFCELVSKSQDYIHAGDIFQVVLSQKFQRPISVDSFAIYRALRVINPSPYLYYLSMDDFSIIGSSPELLVRVEDGLVEVRPIAGTRRRGRSADEDSRLMTELIEDEKEIAEHVMLVDLGRNDVGRVSEFGSVKVTEFKKIEKYSHVMHIVSNVRGKLKPGLTAIDALQAGFPAGTVSGAPKIRAMEIITEFEPSKRGVYAGALGYLDFSGNLDTCIAIRTIVTKDGQAYFQAGAGIVADSVPEREYQETIDKAKALRAAIDFAERGLR
ncbi:anthranilate synthase component I [bacterium]|nr:anthranilate synthase component I [bacterium]